MLLQEQTRRQEIEQEREKYWKRQQRMGEEMFAGKYYRMLLGDLKGKQLPVHESDPLASGDPESIAIEAEAFQILRDLIREVRK